MDFKGNSIFTYYIANLNIGERHQTNGDFVRSVLLVLLSVSWSTHLRLYPDFLLFIVLPLFSSFDAA
jgi:hypothetical protein